MATPSEHASLGQRADRYWVESRQPLMSLVFIAPLLIVYETGAVLLGVQNGAEALFRDFLLLLGFSQHFVLPALTVCILLAWHHLTHAPWRVSGGVLPGMAVESLLLGVCLRIVLFVQVTLCSAVESTATLSIGAGVREAVSYLGAGIYEELLFRLILLSLAIVVMRKAGLWPRVGVIAAVLLTSLLFAWAHHLGAGGEPLMWSRFLFRTLAGVFFSVVFLYRGFGIAAGSHAAYDILVAFFV